MTDETTTVSIQLDDMTLDQLIQLSQGLGRDADKIRDQRRYLNAKIAERLERGERNEQPEQSPHATAPGATIEAGTIPG